MASPFRIFRKNVKPMLAVIVVLLMLSWVIGDSLRSLVGGSPGPAGGQAPGAVAVKWDGGQLTNSELNNLVMSRRLVNSFVRAVAGMGEQRSTESGVEPLPLRVEPIIGPETPQQGVEEHVVYTKLVADLARRAGMKISDEAIVRYLDELGRGRVSREDMRNIIERMQSGGGRASIAYAIDALRDEMLAHNYLTSYQFSLATVTPEERWADWLKSNDRIVLEVAPFPAESFLVDVSEPTDAELMAFVQPPDNPNINYLERDPQPDFLSGGMEFPSPHPGFAIPRKIGVQYIEADYDKFLTKVENDITDEEIAKYYEEHKDLFQKPDTSLFDEPKGSSESSTTKSDATKSSAAEAVDTQVTEERAGDGEQPDSAREGNQDGNETEGTAPPAAETTPPTTDSQDSAPKPPADDSSSNSSAVRSPFRLAAFVQNDDGQPASGSDTTATTESDTDSTAPATGETTDTAPPTDASDSPTTDAATTDASTTNASTTNASTTDETGSNATEKAGSNATEKAGETPAAEKPKQYQPLDEVRDEIRRQLASDRVGKQLAELMEKLYGEVNTEFTKYFSASLNAQLDESGPPPPTGMLANLKPLAEQNGLEYSKTGPLSYLEMRKTQVGESIDPEARASLAGLLFGSKDLSMYQPALTVNLLGNRYLSMKTSDTPRRIPKLADVRDEVAKAWKLRKAAGLALKHAEGLAKKVEEAGSTLTNYFSDDKSVTVVRTDPFSWLTGGEVSRITGQQQPLRLSEPDGVVAAGPEFMSYVFNLNDGQPGATFNHDKSIAYVVRIDDHQLSPEEMRTAYLAESNTWPALGSMIGARMQGATRRLLDDITSAADIQWERPHDQVREDE